MDRAKHGKSNKSRQPHPASGSRYRRGLPLQLRRLPSTIGNMLTTKIAVLVAGGGAAIAASLIPLLSLNSGAAAGPPYTLDEAVQLVQQQTEGTILRAETVIPGSEVTSRGVPSADADNKECPCDDIDSDNPDTDRTVGEDPDSEPETQPDDPKVISRGVHSAPPASQHRIRILQPDGVVRIILVDEQQGIIVPDNAAEKETAQEKN